jgi:uncharacterized iron-regulated membrane protein
MKSLRKTIFWCHLLTGVTAGLVILIMSVTGVLLSYEKQIIAWADTRNYHAAPPSPETPPLPLESLLAKVEERLGVAASTVTIRAEKSEMAAIGLAGGRAVFVNRYTGEILGEGAKGVRDFFHVITDWHRWLGAHGENRAVARAITGACNLGFLFLVVSGLYLWWPRIWTRPQLRNALWFKRGLPVKARDFNWHNVIGFWCLVPLFIVVLSATVISYPWASNLVYRLAGETPPAPAQRAGPGQAPGNARPQRGNSERRGAQEQYVGLDRLWVRAEQQSPGWRIITLRLPASAEAPGVFTIDQGNGGQPQKRAQLTLNRSDGEVVRWEPFSGYSTGRKLRSFLRFAHTGEVAGFIGQTVAGIASLGATFLVWTGLALAWRRLRGWWGGRAKEPIPAITQAD